MLTPVGDPERLGIVDCLNLVAVHDMASLIQTVESIFRHGLPHKILPSQGVSNAFRSCDSVRQPTPANGRNGLTVRY